MTRPQISRARRLFRTAGSQRPTRVERVAIIGVVTAAALASVLLWAFDGFVDPASFFFDVLLTLAFLPLLWNPTLTALALFALMAVSPFADEQQVALLGLAIGCLVVVRYCPARIQAVYLVLFLAAAGGVHRFDQRPDSVAMFSAVLIVAAGASAVGVVLRALVARAGSIGEELVDARRMNVELVREERQRIADDLHDVVAHDLTVIAMHARLLDRTDDPDERSQSQEAILASAKQALVDLRRVVDIAADNREDAARSTDHSLAAAVESFRTALEHAGYDVAVRVNAAADELDLLTVSTLERIIREAATNIMKHAPAPQHVELSVARGGEGVVLRIRNTLAATVGAPKLPGSGYGTARMRERTALRGGTFSSGAHEGDWLLEARFPAH
ncbi:sensor histidine kinase [Microbacterium sp. NPDC055910]|uniref:sensor histidine kinase n=1 Tax=Microbacterium sp. NPDC055910 TaxID=3345659 RepID=UPI0035DC3DB7